MILKRIENILGVLILILVSFSSAKFEEANFGWKEQVFSLSNQTTIFKSAFEPYLDFMDTIFQKLQESNLNITQKCQISTKQLLQLASNGDVGTLSFLDASGKPASGILKGSLSLIGFYSQCLNSEIKNQSLIIPFSGQYCLTTMNFQNESNIFPEESFAVFKRSQKLVIGICVPSTCSSKDVELVVRDSSSTFVSADLVSIDCHKKSHETLDIAAIFIIILFSLFGLLAFFATAFDSIPSASSSKTEPKEMPPNNGAYSNEAMPAKFENNDPPKFEENGSTLKLHNPKPHKAKENSLLPFLFAFSLKRNILKIVSVEVSNNSINSLHGLRFLSMTLIIFGHTYSFASQDMYFRNPDVMSDAPKSFAAQFLSNGTLAVDTFYLISGLLVSLLTLKVMKAKDGKLPLIYFYVHRYIRLTPLFLIVIAFSATLLQYVNDGPKWDFSIMMYSSWCKKNWYLNALYVHNFIDTPNMCLSHTWYLATDMQFYLVTPLIMIPLYKNFIWGGIVSGIFLLITTLTTGILTAVNKFPAVPYMNNAESLEVMNLYYREVYIKPYCRMGPYLIGILAGYILWKYQTISIKKLYISVGWSISVFLMLTVLFSMYGAIDGHNIPSVKVAAAYSSLARTAWALAIAWLIIMCHYGHGGVANSILSFKYFLPFSRLTYSAYLIHPITMAIYYGGVETIVDFSFSFMLYLFIGHFILTYLVSLALSALFESPIIGLERALQKPKEANR